LVFLISFQGSEKKLKAAPFILAIIFF